MTAFAQPQSPKDRPPSSYHGLAAYPVGGDNPRSLRDMPSAGLMILSSEERTSATSPYSNISSTQGTPSPRPDREEPCHRPAGRGGRARAQP